MNENTRRLSQAFIERNDEAYVRDIVSHTPEATQEFADLTARLVELEEQPYLTIHRPTHQNLVRARIWAERPMIEFGSFSRCSFASGHPDRGTQQVCFVAEVYLRPYGDPRESRIHEQEGLLRALSTRNVNVAGETLQTDGWFCREVQEYQLSVNPQELTEMSPIARAVTEALQNGIPLGEAEPRPAHMRFLRYNAGQGRIGDVAEGSGYILPRQNDIYVISTSGEFCIDENNRVTRALNIPEQLCFDCDRSINPFELANDLETALAGHDLNGRRVFFVGSTGAGCLSDSTFPRAIEMLQGRGATVYARFDEAKGLI